MIYLDLFLTFLKIGAVSFGGGLSMIALIREDCLRYGWLTEEGLLNFVAVAESTPGPVAVNIATFVGSSQGGFWGALLATLGVVLPSFIIIVLIASLMNKLLKYAGVKAVINGFRPAVVGMILATVLTLFLSQFLSVVTVSSSISVDFRGLIVLGLMILITFIHKKIKKKAISPFLIILIAGILGVFVYGF